ncbi:MAG: glycosyltransferase [bacterium]
MSKQVVYYTAFGSNPYYQNAKISIQSLIELGKFNGDIVVFSDKPFEYFGVINILIQPDHFSKIFELRYIAGQYFDFSKYDKIMYLDTDILVVRPINPLFENGLDFIYFEEPDYYFLTGSISSIFFDWKTRLTKIYKHSINAGQFVVSGKLYPKMMKIWEQNVDKFRHRKAPVFNWKIKKTWFYDQGALNYIIRTNLIEAEKIYGSIRFPICPWQYTKKSHILFHYAAFPVQLVPKLMQKQLDKRLKLLTKE